MRQGRVILLVEDDPIDQMFIRRALSRLAPDVTLEVANDVQQAIDALEAGDRPNLIVTDLSMPGLDGGELVARLKASAEWKRIPTIVLSTSRNPDDIGRCYDQHANAYIVKPDTVAGYDGIASLLKEFWLEVVASPPSCETTP